jgi:hypothetical protein
MYSLTWHKLNVKSQLPSPTYFPYKAVPAHIQSLYRISYYKRYVLDYDDDDDDDDGKIRMR